MVDIGLNQEYPYYPFANKIFACAHREQNTSADILIFLDGSANGKLINSKLEEFELLMRGSNIKILKHGLYKFYNNFLKRQ